MAQTQQKPADQKPAPPKQQAPKRTIVAQGIVVEARALSLILRHGTDPFETSYPLKQNGLEATPGQYVTIFSDGKFHIGPLPYDWK